VTHVWPTVPLGEIIALSQDEHRVLADSSYPNIGIYSFGRGVFEKPPIEGATTSARSLFQIRAKQFIYSRLFAFEGAYGLVPKAYDGSFVSNEFPSFDIDQERLCPEFLTLHFKLPSTWKALAARTVGMGDRRQRIKPDQLLRHGIPLPPLAEQRRIVAKTERLAAKIDEARGLRKHATTEICLLLRRGIEAWTDLDQYDWMPLQSVLREPSRNGLSTRPNDEPQGVPILRISAGTSRHDAIVEESDHKYIELGEDDIATYKLEHGDLLACRFNGNLHFVGRFSLYLGERKHVIVYPDKLIRFRVDPRLATPEYVRFAMNSPSLREIIESHCQTTAGNLGISAKKLSTVPLPVPGIEEQRRIVAYFDGLQAKVNRLRALQAETRAELDALLPSILDRAFKGEL
jgi:type I restriction enzyme, S subunit